MQINGEKVVAAVGMNGELFAVTDEGRVYVRFWSGETHDWDWKAQTPVPLRRSAQVSSVQSVA